MTMRPAFLRLLHALLAFCVLLAPQANAVSIGEAVMLSRWGEPLRAQVTLRVNPGELVEDGCLSLTLPGAQEDDASLYLTKAKLTVQGNPAQPSILVSGTEPFNEAFAKLRLQIKCANTGGIIKILTLLPELTLAPPEVLEPPVVKPAVVAASAVATSISPVSDKTPLPVAKTLPPPVTPAAPKPEKTSKVTVTSPASNSASFSLRLSGEALDMSRVGSLSSQDREILLAQQKMLDADDQMADMLAMRHELQLMRQELEGLKARLPQSQGTAASAPVVASAPQAVPSNAAGASWLEENLPLIGLLAGLAAATVLVWLGLRRISRKKMQAATHSYRQEKRDAAPLVAAHAPTEVKVHEAKAHETKAAGSAQKAMPFAPPPPPASEAAAESDLILEEAQLYAVHNRPQKAIEMLSELITTYPKKMEAWLALLSLYSAQGEVGQFEKVARRLQSLGPEKSVWSRAQALGRTLDRDNRLYRDDGSAVLSDSGVVRSSGRPIGDVLVAMGLLSPQDMQNCLDEFNPRVDGRFGGYLISRKMITYEQLDEALLHQQGLSSTGKPAGTLPTLEEMEILLEDFDAERDGSVLDYLLTRKGITPDQLGHSMTFDALAEAEAPAPASKSEPLDFLIDLDFHPAAPATTEPLSAVFDRFQPMDFDLNLEIPPAKKTE